MTTKTWPANDGILITPYDFEDELMKLWAAQQELTDKVGALLDSCRFKSEEYVDWLNDFCLGEGGQIERLVDMYKWKFAKG